MTYDVFALRSGAAVDPARQAFPVVPHDTDQLATLACAIYVGTGGTIVLRAADSAADVTLKNLASGQIVDVRALYVRAAGTTAADLVALA